MCAHVIDIGVDRSEPVPKRFRVVLSEAQYHVDFEPDVARHAHKRDGDASMPPGKMNCWMRTAWKLV